MAITNEILGKLRQGFFSQAGAYVIGLPLTFLVQVLLARLLTVKDFGAFGFVLSIATMASIPVIAGLPMLLTRQVAEYVHAANLAKYRALLACANTWVAILSFALILVVFFISVNSASTTLLVLKENTLFFALIVPILGFNSIRSGIMKGLGHPGLSELPNQVLLPCLLIAGYLLWYKLGSLSSQSALLIYVAASFLTFIVSITLLLLKRPQLVSKQYFDFDDLPKWTKSMLPFAAMSAIWTLSAQISIFLLGLLGELDAVAAMRVAERAAMLISLPMMFINASMSPLIVKFIRDGDNQGLQSLMRYSARMACLMALPAAFVLIVFGKWLIGITFGARYSDIAYMPMVILVAGHAISLIFGPAGICLIMSGQEKLNLWIQVFALIVLFSVAIALIGLYGAVGAAFAVSSSLIFASTAAFAGLRYHLKIKSSVF